MRMRRLVRLAMVGLFTTGVVFRAEPLAAQTRSLVWSDEFNGASVDLTQWQFGQGVSNDNLQYYTGRIDNAQVTGGALQIIAKKESYLGAGYTSALLQTRHAVYWKYGRIEARIKLPGTPGFVPAFWLLPEDDLYGWWPNSGEIDIMEYPTTQGGTIYGTAHSQAHSYFSGTVPLGSTIALATAESAFHLYAVEWTPDSIGFYVDQTKYFSVVNDHTGHQSWPFDQPFYVILNLAVGGGWVGAPTTNTVFPAVMQVDYVRVYQYPGDVGIAGKDFVQTGAKGVVYAVPQLAGSAYAWTLPVTAQIVSGQNTSALTVNWGNTGGDVSAVVTTASVPTTVHYPVEVSKNLLSNPGFEKGVKYWNGVMSPLAKGSFSLDTSTATHTGHSLRSIVTVTPTNPWDSQITQNGFLLEAGKHYEGSLWARSTTAGAKLNAGVINAATYALYGSTVCMLTAAWTRFTFLFTAPVSATGSFNVDLGVQPAAYSIDDVSLLNLDNQAAVDEGHLPGIPARFSLEQNYPNPFNPSTTITYELPKLSHVTLSVFDILGREVGVLVNETKDAGVYGIIFDGSKLASGVYFCRLQAGDFVQSRKIVMLK